MSKGQQCFDQVRLKLFLNEQLDERDESKVLEHINICHSCQQALENIAAGKKAWSDLKCQLADHLDLDVTSETAPFHSKDRDVELEKLKEYLGPTDNPEMLGRLGSYEVCGLVGRGSTGVVVKALDTRLNRYVAIKVLSPSFSSNGPARTRFEREGRSVAAVSHEHVVPIHSVNEYRGLPFIVMHYVDGGSLHQRIEKSGPLDTCEVVRIGMQIARGLSAAHGQGIIHRDVKPANVMLESGVDRAMVSDFGLARVADEAAMTRSGVIAGTPQYMSPEQAMGDPIDPRSDLFSLGSVLYASCTGRPPFRSETVFGVIKRVCESNPRPIREINPDIAPWLESLIAKLHEKDRDDRFESAEQVAEILNRELAHLQSPSFVPEPDRPWLVEVAPTAPVKASKVGSFGLFGWVSAAVFLLAATLSTLWLSGMLPMEPGQKLSWLEQDKTADGNTNGFAVWQTDTPEAVSRYRASLAKGQDKRSIDRGRQGNPYPWLTSLTSDGEEKNVKVRFYQSHSINVEEVEDELVDGQCSDCSDCDCPDSECTASGCTSSQCESCECECDSLECESESCRYDVVHGDKGIAGRLVAVKREYPGEIVDGFLVYLPVSYDKTDKDYPVIMFLTGGCGVGGKVADLSCWCLPNSIQGELESDLDLEDEHKKLMMDSFIVIAPHMKDGSFKSRQFFEQEDAIEKILDEIQEEYRADSSRVYLTGSGRGGHGTWGLASRMPTRFAAIAPIRGMKFGISDYTALKDMPMWIGHNVDDEEVEFEETEAVVSKLLELDGKEFMTIEKEDATGLPYMEQRRILTSYECGCWPDLYASAPLYKWFLRYSNKSRLPKTQEVVAVLPKSEDVRLAIMSVGASPNGFAVITDTESLDKDWKSKLKEIGKELEEFESNIEKSIAVVPGGKLLINTNLGHIKMKTGDEKEVKVKVIRKVAATSEEIANEIFEAQKFDFDPKNHGLESGRDAVVVATMDKETQGKIGGWRTGGIQYRTMEYEISIPARFNVDVHTRAGHILSPEIDGSAKLNTSGGHIELSGCSDSAELYTNGGHLTIGSVKGSLIAKTSGGHIKVKDVSGNAKLRTSGGNIDVTNTNGAVDAQTSGGNIDVVINKQPGEGVSLNTSAGNVKVGLTRDVQLNVNARTNMGNISGSAVKTKSKKKQVEFLLNGGGPRLEASTSVGNINLYFLKSDSEIPEI